MTGACAALTASFTQTNRPTRLKRCSCPCALRRRRGKPALTPVVLGSQCPCCRKGATPPGPPQPVLQFSESVPHLTLEFGSLVASFTVANRVVTGGRWAVTLYSHVRSKFVSANNA